MSPDAILMIDGGFLKPMTAFDIHEGYVTGLNDPLINRFLEVRHKRQTTESVTEFVYANTSSNDSVLWGIWLAGASYPCGTVRLHGVEYSHGTAHIGICLFDKSVWGQHLGSKAIAAVTRWALNGLHLRWIEAGAYADNVASQKAFVAAGYELMFEIPGKYLLDGKPVDVKVFAARI